MIPQEPRRCWQFPSVSFPILLVSLCLPVVLACGGCNGGSVADLDSEEFVVRDLVDQITGASSAEGSFEAHFAAGAAPTGDREKYDDFEYAVRKGQVSITGDTEATIQVEVGDTTTGLEIETLEWTAVKEAGTWKLKTAPLPAP